MEIFRRRLYACKHKVLARARASDIEQPPLCLVYLVKLGLVSGVGDTLVEGKDAFVTGHDDDRPEFQPLGQVHVGGRQPFGSIKVSHRSTRTPDEFGCAHENTDFVPANALS